MRDLQHTALPSLNPSSQAKSNTLSLPLPWGGEGKKT
jgi:hypothetical protein